MPVSRMRMRPWLEKMIDSNRISGLRWVDKESGIFSVAWKHAARHGWELQKDASLFKEWAIHTGKYVEGQSCDPKTWKANFRCAMNSLPDIEEVKDKSINKGHGAVRVFRMLPVTPKSRDRRNKTSRLRAQTKVKDEEESSDSDFVNSPVQASTPSPHDNSMESTVKTEQPDFPFKMQEEFSHWSGFSFDLPRRFEVSPTHSMCPDDNEIIEICAQWERERNWPSSLSNNGFLSVHEQCLSPGSLHSSDPSSADELEELQYTMLDSSYSSSDWRTGRSELFGL